MNEVTKRKISKTLKKHPPENAFKKGHVAWNYKGGKPHCKTCEKLLSSYTAVYCNSCWRVGINNPAWKGGRTSLNTKIRHLPEYNRWRSDVFTRDNWTCQTCKKRGGELHAHHIKSLLTIIKENNITNIWEAQMCKELWDVDNGVTLCKDDHELTEDYLKNSFQRTEDG